MRVLNKLIYKCIIIIVRKSCDLKEKLQLLQKIHIGSRYRSAAGKRSDAKNFNLLYLLFTKSALRSDINIGDLDIFRKLNDPIRLH